MTLATGDRRPATVYMSQPDAGGVVQVGVGVCGCRAAGASTACSPELREAQFGLEPMMRRQTAEADDEYDDQFAP
jgi:hypothetical protein